MLSLLKVYKAAGYNAVLVEWEDQFPWAVDERFRNETAYTSEQVRAFHDEAARLEIEIIPLVQCLGHMETPLGVGDYAHLREVPDRSDVLNPLATGARELVEKMIDDVLKLTPSPRHFHVGGDEAWTFGTHADTKKFIEQHGKGALYLHHVEPLLDKLHALGIRPILWHDMMLSWNDDALRRLSRKADLMVWGYQGRVDRTRSHHALANFERLKSAGMSLWGATAYKGADGHNSDLPDFHKRGDNAQGYADIARQFDLKGICATAWSRYNTHRVQVEPIDAALDCLVNVGSIITDGSPLGEEKSREVLKRIGELERFEACRKSMTHLTAARQTGWCAVQNLREQRVLQRLDPRRADFHAELPSTKALKQVVHDSGALQEGIMRSFNDLVPQVWMDRYVAERMAPLAEELAELDLERPGGAQQAFS